MTTNDSSENNSHIEGDPCDAHLFRWPLQSAIDRGLLLDITPALQTFRVRAKGYVSVNAWTEFTRNAPFDPQDHQSVLIAFTYSLTVAKLAPAITRSSDVKFIRVPFAYMNREHALLQATVVRLFPNARAVLFTLARRADPT